MSIAPERYTALRQFVLDHAALLRGEHGPVDPAAIVIDLASADASFRNYWRVHGDGASWIVMNSPPDKLDVAPWLDVGRRLSKAGLHAPEVIAADTPQGFLLIEDLGMRTYLNELSAATVDGLYTAALDALLAMQQRVDPTGLPPYDERRLVMEMELLPEWLLTRHLGVQPGCDDWDELELAFRVLTNAALEQPRAFLHRDYHSRNLLVTATASPGIIDFQDALHGPLTYDLVSLLRDCYIVWPQEQVTEFAERHRRALRDAGVADIPSERFLRWFDLMGLQRHIKVLGLFCRLWYRDGKQEYLGSLPRVLRYVLDVAARYPELAGFVRLLERCTAGRDLTAAA